MKQLHYQGDAASESGPGDPLQVLAETGSGLSTTPPIATQKELDRCSSDIEYMLRTYVRVKTDDGTRPLTEEEIAAAVIRSRYPDVTIGPKRGYYHTPSMVSAWAYLAKNRPLLPVPISHYLP